MSHEDEVEQAARWHARLSEAADGAAEEATRVGADAWLRMSADRRRAFAAVAVTDAVADDLRDDPALRTFADEALARAEAHRGWRPRWGVAMLAAGAVILPVAALTVRHLSQQPAPPPAAAPTRVYATAAGEQRLVTLPDATRVLLDTSSRLTVRGAMLSLQGQAAITAGSTPVDLAVPGARIGLRAGSANVRADAGRVDVLAQGPDVTATVASLAHPQPVAARNGQSISVTSRGIDRATAPDPGAITAWQTGWLQFDDVPLSRALREVNRYRQRPIRMVGDGTKLRISGSFRTGKGETFLDTVDGALPVTIDRTATPPTIRIGEASK